ncbi:MAG: HAMP domain-containing histidine kinase [Deltaproteobacteria bacterium]|nr:HAMP domain-containing histidine kinase [Deltaproteobacteria bacterium]
MEYRSSISRRIVISFVVLTAIVSGLFGIGVIGSIEFLEEHLFSAELKHQLMRSIADREQDKPLHLVEGTEFFVGEKNLPRDLEGLAIREGFNEFELKERSCYVFLHREQGIPYYLVKDQTSFEQREQILRIVVLCCFSLSILGALLLGRMTVKKIIAPIRRLTLQVQDREMILPDTPPLSSDYADDEIGLLARTFDKTLGMLQEALQRESFFTSDISHELRNPLMMIQSSCEILIEKNRLDDYTRCRIEVIRKAAADIQELVTAFLTLARHKRTELASATLEEIVQAGLEEWQKEALAKGISFVVEADPESSLLENRLYPSALLHTVLNNLVWNAIHYSDGGRIALCLKGSGFELSDTGQGIAESDKTSIFKPFYRGSRRYSQGIGLGLSLVKRICDREGWVIEVSDNHPVGTRFEVFLR